MVIIGLLIVTPIHPSWWAICCGLRLDSVIGCVGEHDAIVSPPESATKQILLFHIEIIHGAGSSMKESITPQTLQNTEL